MPVSVQKGQVKQSMARQRKGKAKLRPLLHNRSQLPSLSPLPLPLPLHVSIYLHLQRHAL